MRQGNMTKIRTSVSKTALPVKLSMFYPPLVSQLKRRLAWSSKETIAWLQLLANRYNHDAFKMEDGDPLEQQQIVLFLFLELFR
jgi:hypothetical protein